MSVNFRKILFLFSLLIVFTIKQKCTEEEGFTIAKFNEIINGDLYGEYKHSTVKVLLFIVDNFGINPILRNPKKNKKNSVFAFWGLSFAYCPFQDVINISEKCTISFFNSHINFIKFILHTIRFFFHFYCDYTYANNKPSWKQALWESAQYSLLLNTLCNIHLFTISYHNIKINLFSCINILHFCVYVIENVEDIRNYYNDNNGSGNNNNTNNNANDKTGKNSSFFINFNHHHDCYSYTTAAFNFFLEPFKGSSRLYLVLYPRIEIFL